MLKTTEVREKFMNVAIQVAEESRKHGNHAVGAVVVKDGNIIATGEQKIVTEPDPTGHAEVIAIRNAAKKVGHRHLDGCTLYTTHEPCPMCTSAAIWAKIETIVYGATMEDMAEYCRSNGNSAWSWRTIDIKARDIAEKGTPRVGVVEGIMREECKKLFHKD